MTFITASLLTQITKLSWGPTGTGNWIEYSRYMENLFNLDDSWKIVNGSETRPVTSSPSSSVDTKPDLSALSEGAAWDKKAKTAQSHIFFTVDPDLHPLIDAATNGPTSWAILKKEFEKDTASHRIRLRTRFWHARHDPSKPMAEYVNSIAAAARELKVIGHGPEETETIDVILINLHPSFASIRTVLSNRHPPFSLSELCSALIEEQSIVKIKDEDPDAESALAARGRSFPSRKAPTGSKWGNPSGGPGCDRCGDTGHHAKDCFMEMPNWRKDEIIQSRPSRHEGARIASTESGGSETAAYARVHLL